MIKKVFHRFSNKIMNIILNSKILFLRNIFWEKSAEMIDKTWGTKKNDYTVLEYIIKKYNPQRLLDIGCGSGRCFPLYDSLKVPEVYAQDVSKTAIRLCKEKYSDLEYEYILGNIENLKFSENYFDLIISTRVLAAILPDNINNVIKKVCNISTKVYINEMSDSDALPESLYWFKHDYNSLFEKNNFIIIEQGSIAINENNKQFVQTWKLFSKQS